MLSIIDYLKHPTEGLESILQHFFTWLPDKLYLQLMYRVKIGHRLNLKNPRTFSEKLQWLKLYNRRSEYIKMVDKYAVKEYVSGVIGEKYIIPTLGVWDKPEDIEWDKLPDKFVLKCTHDSGGLVICKDKSRLDKAIALKKLKSSIRRNFYMLTKEWPYKNVPRRIIAEQFIEAAPDITDLPDYKWYCFNGEPKYCQVIQNRSENETIDFFDTKWNHQDFVGLNPFAGPAVKTPARPHNLELQIGIARKLSKGMPFSRIDLYEIENKTYFGEITLYPMSGMGKFKPEQYNDELGKLLKLPSEPVGGRI